MIRLLEKKRLSILVLTVLYGVGVIGLSIKSLQQSIIVLTAVNLLITAFLMIWNYARIDNRLILACLFTYLTGFIVEVIGVQTGVLFGSYAYSGLLGPRILGTPLMIGVNWLLMIISVWSISILFFKKLLLAALMGAALMVLMDLLIEPFAIFFNLWTWENNDPPIQNYLAWFGISFLILLIFGKLVGQQRNAIASFSYFVMLIFFCLVGFLNYF